MRAFVLIGALLWCSSANALLPAMTEADARQAVASGACMSLPVGTGLVGGKGWLHSPIPGPHEVRVVGGTAGLTALKRARTDFDAGRLYMVTVDAPAGAVLEWKVPGHAWGPVPVGFQLPPTGAPR